ncbi:MAG: hypothetical protein IJ794_15495 [Lachnospiraceae bacterium]|nr:hypothetical protein [Lachnospiraceae bacterium]
MDEIFQKHLYLFLPFYIMRYEHDMAEIASDDSRKDALLKEYEDILERLEETMADEPDMFQDLLQLMRKVADYQLSPYFDLREEVGAVMGGKVLPLPSDALREARAEGMQQGIEQSVEQSIRNLMETMQWTAEQAMQALKVPDEEWEKYLRML